MKIRGYMTILLASLALGALLVGLVATSISAQEPDTSGNQASVRHFQMRLLESSAERIVLTVQIPDYAVAQQLVDGKTYDVISIPDWGLTDEAGAPQLPIKRVMLGIPLNAKVQLKVVKDATRVGGPFNVLPAPETVLLNDPSLDAVPWAASPEFERRFSAAPEVYGTNAFYPETIARLGEVGFIRHQRVAAIELLPMQYNPGSGEVLFHPEIQVELTFSHPLGRQTIQPSILEGKVYERLLENQLLNYSSAKMWRGTASTAALKGTLATASQQWPLSSPAYKIPITQEGLYQLTYDQLFAAGPPPVTVDPDTLQIFWNGEEIAIQVEAGIDGTFDSGDYLLFYGEGIQHKYTNENVYWLTYGQSVGRRMPEQQGQLSATLPVPVVFMTHSRAEKDSRYLNLWPGDDSVERFIEKGIAAPGEVTASLQLMNVSSETVTSTLWASVWGYTSESTVNPDHHAELYVNGQLVGEHWWDGNVAAQWIEVDFAQSLLINGENTLKIRFPGDTGASYESVFFDHFELRHGHSNQADSNQLAFIQPAGGTRPFEITGFTASDVEVYDITEPMTVTRHISTVVEPVVSTYTVRFTSTVPTTSTYLALTPDRWLTPLEAVLDSQSDLHGTSNGADYILISPAEFRPAAEQLATYRAGQGMRTMVVDLEDVYDEFGYGLSVPDAIHDFLKYAFENWQPPAPTYAVLVGDGTFDPKNHLNQGNINYVTPYLAAVDPFMVETAADNRYVSISGNDIWPDIVLGRLPVNSLAEAQVIVNKTIAYEQTQGRAAWNQHLIFVADIQPDPLGAGSFHDVSDDILQTSVPAPYDVTKVYLGTIPGSTCATAEACQEQLVSLINAPGALLVNYIGHGSIRNWAGIFRTTTIDGLTNADRFPIMLPMTCLEGYFIYTLPANHSLGELLVRADGKGAVASWSPTGLGVADGHDYLNKGFLEAVLVNGVRRLGPATYEGKWRLYDAGFSLEQIEEYTVLGDPALQIPALDLDFLFLPIVLKQSP